MRVECVSFPVLLLLFICKTSLVASVEHTQQFSQGSEEEQRKENAAARDLMRYFFIAFHNNYPSIHYGRNTMGIPFRPVRRIGSEFLGKRSDRPLLDDHLNELSENKRALGSEFLGKRRLGSEFLGKRNDAANPALEDLSWMRPYQSYDVNAEKRALGSEFLGKRRQNLWDWGWKSGYGSDFLGKRVLGSEFLGKRSVGGGRAEGQGDADQSNIAAAAAAAVPQ